MVLSALGPKPTRRGSIHGGVAGHFLHGVAPQAATSTSVGAAGALALARAAALLLLSVPCLVCSCYCSCSCSCCCSRSCSCLRCCSNLVTLQSIESNFGSVDFQGVGGSPELRKNQPQRGGGSPERYPTIYLRVQDEGGGCRRWRGGGVGIAGEKARHGGARGMAGAAADRRWGVFLGRAGRRTAGHGRRGLLFGRLRGWRLKMNRRPLILYPTAAKSPDPR